MIRRLLVAAALLLPAPAAADYPDSARGLRSYLETLVEAARAGRNDWLAGQTRALALPGHDAWFRETFGPDHGAALTAQYARSLPEMEEKLAARFRQAASLDRRLRVETMALADARSGELAGALQAVEVALARPARLYFARLAAPSPEETRDLGLFVHHGGAFRLVGCLFVIPQQGGEALLLAPLGEQVQYPRQLRRPPMRIPATARAAGAWGKVRMLAILNREGALRRPEIIEGHQALAQPALGAARQWRFSPALIGGEAVEVYLLLDLDFGPPG